MSLAESCLRLRGRGDEQSAGAKMLPSSDSGNATSLRLVSHRVFTSITGASLLAAESPANGLPRPSCVQC